MSPNPTTSARVADYSGSHPPCLQVEPGQTFHMLTADRFEGLSRGEPLNPEVVSAVVGPVSIAGVQPGDLVSIEIVDIQPTAEYAYMQTSATYGILGERLTRDIRRVPTGDNLLELAPGVKTAYRPMIGKLGLAPGSDDTATHLYGDNGGALSNIHAGPGARVLLRAYHPGGLVYLEDVHAGMGDGEATASAIEMPADVSLRCTVENQLSIEPPVIITPDEVLTLGQADDLDTAAELATEAMLKLIQSHTGLSLSHAAMIVGAAVDVRVAFIGAQPRKAYAAISRSLIGY